MERGIVSSRVALLLRSTEIKPWFCDLSPSVTPSPPPLQYAPPLAPLDDTQVKGEGSSPGVDARLGESPVYHPASRQVRPGQEGAHSIPRRRPPIRSAHPSHRAPARFRYSTTPELALLTLTLALSLCSRPLTCSHAHARTLTSD